MPRRCAIPQPNLRKKKGWGGVVWWIEMDGTGGDVRTSIQYLVGVSTNYMMKTYWHVFEGKDV